MNVQITYKEIGDLIAGKYNVSPVFKTVDAKTVEVSYNPAGFFPDICMRFHIEAMRRDIVCMTYDCAPATALIISGIVEHLEKAVPSGLEIKTTDKRVNVYMQRFEQIEKALEHVSLSNITFEEDAMNVALTIVKQSNCSTEN